ncbi:LysR family transcriptional regulator [Sphingobium sp. BYY-5]|uniref:LysR family transcriptional regulator n=1 Tax=Sphingobium sp. BYY-5 TaxID=2926400 RepID=UPI001FA6FDBB|nr:LysR family transcriptional regulator [Sphingobium sp. BYY-5]MCI4590780.1 LysR family transcriptional regulator [Sphingobium sp. BYY-5]
MDLYGIDLNLLVAFDALIAERNVTRAGLRVGRTQPAMSASLNRLRDLLRDELFVRGPKGLHPTPRALELAEPISRALRDIQHTLVFTQAFEPSAASMTFSLGLSGHAESVVLPPLLQILAARAPLIDLRVRDYATRDEATRMLDAGEVDVAVGLPPVDEGRILSARLFQERFVCILRRDHPAANRAPDLERFLSLPHILVSPENEGLDVADAALASKGLKRRVALTIQHMASAPALVAASDMVATVLESVVRRSGCAEQLKVSDFPLRLNPVPFVLNWHRRNDHHPAQRWFRTCLSGAFPQVWQRSEQVCADLRQQYY